MPFGSTASIVKADVDNMLRGLNRDNTDNSHTGDTNKTDLASVSITGGTIGATGGFYFLAVGIVTGTAGNKTIDVDFGSTNIFTTGSVGGAADWFIEGWIFNTATNAQRILTKTSTHNSLSNFAMNYNTASIDTTASQTLRVRVTLANGADTVNQTMWNVFVVQIT